MENNMKGQNENGNEETLADKVCNHAPRRFTRSNTCTRLMDKLIQNNALWSQAQLNAHPDYFSNLCTQQAPKYLWIGCSDSRVPANQILGLEPGEVFVQRNVGNQALHTDLNAMSCIEYAVKELKVRVIIVCGHYGCGAVKSALHLPSKTQSLVNCWISNIRDCRDENQSTLMALDPQEQVDRLCEFNVIQQAFHVCTCPIVQWAWDAGQELSIYGIIYSLKDGLIHKLVGPISGNEERVVNEATSFLDLSKMSLENRRSLSGPLKEERLNNHRFSARMYQHTAWETNSSPEDSPDSTSPHLH